MFIGHGTYGNVYEENGTAVKNFKNVSHLVQEYMALRYLNGSKYIVELIDFNVEKNNLRMKLYESNLKKWLIDYNRSNVSSLMKFNTKLKIIEQILYGLIEIHDRKLSHGDIKLGNILIQSRPLKIVIADCGFVSNEKYTKIERTASPYRDPILQYDYTHDMYSFGICFVEIISGYQINHQIESYSEIHRIVNQKISNRKYRDFLINDIFDRNSKTTAHDALKTIFNKTYNSNFVSVPQPMNDDRQNPIRNEFRDLSEMFEINRAKIGYFALTNYLNENNFDQFYYPLLISLTVFVMYSIFGIRKCRCLKCRCSKCNLCFSKCKCESDYRNNRKCHCDECRTDRCHCNFNSSRRLKKMNFQQVLKRCYPKYSKSEIYHHLEGLIKNKNFVDLIFYE